MQAEAFPIKQNTMLDVVDENDVVIGQASRAEIHDKGLLHREVYVVLVTPDRKVIFQRRAKDKDTFPDMLDTAVGGHVELGQSYEDAVLREVEEETGLRLGMTDLTFITKFVGNYPDTITKRINRSFRQHYAYLYTGDVTDLRVEGGAGAGFVAISLDDLYARTSPVTDEIIPVLLDLEYQAVYRAVAAALLD